MFSFHRPKVYRSSTGCCICKAKSSSSRFTDSKKYEEDFLECFKLASPRQGEICNACVLLVKRWKKLPAGSERNWQHVVDARAGPGMKSFTKYKCKSKKGDEKATSRKKKQFEREFSPALSDKSDDIDMDFLSEEGPSMGSSPGASDGEETVVETGRRHKPLARRRPTCPQGVSGFIDLDYWKKEELCCGTIFRGANGEVMIDPSYIKPCSGRMAAMCKARDGACADQTQERVAQLTETAPKPPYSSDSSSDSGYDESSNPSATDHQQQQQQQRVSIGPGQNN
ncbi:SIN3-HDAC complex-associated factor [Cylas formicarius]|uniref:SIN3-HDAC complex-associated factor n=1 Tax=Cylas formicarius TaxID=197179 RepID=UPI00295881AF|nr:SIN3-HDAC complex-associated factor [Cylas formicarius]